MFGFHLATNLPADHPQLYNELNGTMRDFTKKNGITDMHVAGLSGQPCGTYEEATDEDCHILPLTGLNAFVYIQA